MRIYWKKIKINEDKSKSSPMRGSRGIEPSKGILRSADNFLAPPVVGGKIKDSP